jgi:predicted PhzF superfamily epimerase YddE/YHI9
MATSHAAAALSAFLRQDVHRATELRGNQGNATKRQLQATESKYNSHNNDSMSFPGKYTKLDV